MPKVARVGDKHVCPKIDRATSRTSAADFVRAKRVFVCGKPAAVVRSPAE